MEEKNLYRSQINLEKNPVQNTYCVVFQTDERVEIREGASYVDYQTNMVKLAKNIAREAQDMVSYTLLIP